MASPRSRAEQCVRDFLVRIGKDTEFTDETSLFAGGIGLDSLETAELSSTLEDELGDDPFSSGTMAETVGAVLAHYSDEAPPA